MIENQTHRDPTDAEKAILATYVQANGAGKDAAQMAAELNEPTRAVPNPAPQGRIPVSILSKDDFSHRTFAAYMAITALPDSDPNKSTYLAGFAYVRDYITGDVDLTLPTIVNLFTMAARQGLVTDPSLLTTNPDPAYQPTVQAGPLAFQMFGRAVAVEASDFA